MENTVLVVNRFNNTFTQDIRNDTLEKMLHEFQSQTKLCV